MMAALSSIPYPDLETVFRMLMTCPDAVSIICLVHQSKKRRLAEEFDSSEEPMTAKQK